MSRGVDLAASPLLARDDADGVERYRLAGPVDRSVGVRRPAPCASADGRFVWLYGGDVTDRPTLAVADLDAGAYRPVASVTPGGATPWVDPDTGAATVAEGDALSVYEPDAVEDPRLLGRFDPPDRPVGEPIAGVTRSADGSRYGALFAADGEATLATLAAETGETAVWHTRERRYDRLRFSPTDDSLALLSRDATDGAGGEAWLAREGLGARPLRDLLPDHHRCLWWGDGGTGIWYVEPRRGVGRLHLERASRDLRWSASALSAHATRGGRLLAATVHDGDGRAVVAYDSRAETETVVERVPAGVDWDPRPQFVAGDSLLLYTATVDGRPAVTLVPTAALRDR